MLKPLRGSGKVEPRIICIGEKKHVDLQEHLRSNPVEGGLIPKTSLLVMEFGREMQGSVVGDRANKISAGQRQSTDQGVMIGTVWCPFVSLVRKEGMLSIPGSGVGLHVPRRLQEKEFK